VNIRSLIVALGAGVLSLGTAAPAAADNDTRGYVKALDAAGLIDHDGKTCNIVNGVCHPQYDDLFSAVSTGSWVCKQVEQGRSRSSIVYDLSHGEGLMPSSYNAPIIYNAATTYLC
jgi:Protein of unknown function (DUF732)